MGLRLMRAAVVESWSQTLYLPIAMQLPSNRYAAAVESWFIASDCASIANTAFLPVAFTCGHHMSAVRLSCTSATCTSLGTHGHGLLAHYLVASFV